MRKELGLLNFICILVALGFLAMAVISALGSGDFLTIDNLFIITVCLVMALMFVVPFLFHLYYQGKLPVPFIKRHLLTPRGPGWDAISSRQVKGSSQIAPKEPPLLDAKGRAVPPDVRAIMNRMAPTETKDA